MKNEFKLLPGMSELEGDIVGWEGDEWVMRGLSGLGGG